MKAITINVQITKCPKQYESVRLGGEWSVDEGETVEEVLSKATELLNEYYTESQKPKEQPKAQEPQQAVAASGKQVLTMKDSRTVEAICKRIGEGVKLEKVLEYYEPDEDVKKVLELAAKLESK